MNPIDIIEHVYHATAQPVEHVQSLSTELRHWYQAFPAANYLQPCVIDGQAALVCQRQLSSATPHAFKALKAICQQYGIYLKEDVRTQTDQCPVAHNRRQLAIVLTFCLTMASAVQAANVVRHPTSSGLQALPQTIAMVCHKQTLSAVTLKIAEETGIQFKFNVAVEQDMVNRKLQAQDWKEALSQLLGHYNYSTIQEGDIIKKVFITGYKGGVKPVELSGTELPDDQPKASGFFTDKVMQDITIPTEELTNLPEAGEMQVDLPIGSFNVKQESMVALEDGTLSWVGTMDDDAQFYRLYLAQTQDGEVIGNVFTPDGTYNIETIDGQTVMVSVDQVSMQ
jgi:hypothetical protein